MKLNEFTQKFNQIHKGSFVKITWKSDVPVSAKYKGTTVEKVSTGVVRLGVKFANMKSTQERGKPVGSLTYGQWREGYESVILEHRGKQYIRFSKSNNKYHYARTQYLLNGKPISKEELMSKDIVRPSYWKKRKSNTEIFNVKLENVLRIWR